MNEHELNKILLQRSKIHIDEILSRENHLDTENTFKSDFNSLTNSQKHAKAALLLSKFLRQRNSSSLENYSSVDYSAVDNSSLEEAAIILDGLSQTNPSFRVYQTLTLIHGLAGRFSEAQDSLEKAQQFGLTNKEFKRMDELLTEKNKDLRTAISRLNFKPSKSYVLNYTPENDASLQRLLNDALNDAECSEILAVVDNINDLPSIKNKFKDFIYTIETEQHIHEQFSPASDVKLRVILKNNNNGLPEKGINFGIRKAKQSSLKKIIAIDNNGEKNDGAKYLSKSVAKVFPAPSQLNIAFFGTTTENTHGVPVVMNNIIEQLKLDSKYKVFIIANSFDNTEIAFADDSGKEHVFADRKNFSAFMKNNNLKLDLMHVHSWHLSDYYKPFHSMRDEMRLELFLGSIGQPKLIFTDHSNPTEDIRKIRELYSIDYLLLSDNDKGKFLYRNLLDFVEQWPHGWEPTSILSRRDVMDKSHATVFVSQTQMKEEETVIPYYQFQKKSSVIMNGVDMEKYNTCHTQQLARELRTDLGIAPEEKVVLYAGRLEQEKGIYELAKASEIMHAQGDNFTVLYLGSSDPMPQIKKKIREYSPHVKVLFPKRIERHERKKMAAMYALADVVAQPTWGECFNQTVAESLAMETPAIVSDVSAPGEIYVRSGAALGTKVKAPEDLADKLSMLLHNQELREQLKKNGKKLIKTFLSVEIMGAKYKNLYENLTKC